MPWLQDIKNWILGREHIHTHCATEVNFADAILPSKQKHICLAYVRAIMSVRGKHWKDCHALKRSWVLYECEMPVCPTLTQKAKCGLKTGQGKLFSGWYCFVGIIYVRNLFLFWPPNKVDEKFLAQKSIIIATSDYTKTQYLLPTRLCRKAITCQGPGSEIVLNQQDLRL